MVKVVTNVHHHALYFSRSSIPYPRNPGGVFFKHIGLYGYTREALLRIGEHPRSHLEETEALEQLKFLEYGMVIRVNETHHETLGIDTPQDLERFRELVGGISR